MIRKLSFGSKLDRSLGSRRRILVSMTENKEKEEYYCEVCGRKISKEEYESYDGLCWECWDDQMTEECEFEEDII